jgi:2'-5' RNA ligase superfamily
LIPVPEAEPLVSSFRRGGDWSSEHGIPAHLTLAGPRPLTTCIPEDRLGKLCAEIRGERYKLDTLGPLGDAVCLFPDDDRALLGWRGRILAAVGSDDETDESWRMHLTVGRGLAPPAIGAVEASIGRALPLHCEIDRVLIAQRHAGSRVTLRPL